MATRQHHPQTVCPTLLGLVCLLAALTACSENPEKPGSIDASAPANDGTATDVPAPSDASANVHCDPETAPCKDDENKCNGEPYCADLGGGAWACKPNPATVPACAGDASKPCVTRSCEPATGTCVDQPVSKTKACDDGDPCTEDDRCVALGQCAGTPSCECLQDADCAAKDDGDPCNGVVFCRKDALPWTCQHNPASVVHCAAASGPCRTNACDPATGKCAQGNKADGAGCEDGQACTGPDACKDGACAPGKAKCPCAKHADCAAFEDGDLCNGALYCDTKAGNCAHNPATEVQCPSVSDDACLASQCVKKSGTCALLPRPDGVACDDGFPCTTGTSCHGGQCKKGTNNCPCAETKDCAKHEDKDACNGTLWCDQTANGVGKAGCAVLPATVVHCNKAEDSACAESLCDPKTGGCGLASLPSSATCSDGNPCTAPDTCAGGNCKAGPLACACAKDADCAQPGMNLCLGALFCDLASKACTLNAATKVTCSAQSDSACLRNTCQPLTGTCAMKPQGDGQPCDDGQPCTAPDRCKGGTCTAGPPACPCSSDAECAVWDDGDPCNGTLSCTSGSCAPQPPQGCPDDGDPCTQAACDSKTGCFHAPVTAACQAGNDKGVCVGGKCQAGGTVGAPPAGDRDHDYVPDATDTCPLVWNPHNDPAACPAWDGAGWLKAREIGLSVAGQAAGTSAQLRTNQVVEVPLRNSVHGELLAHFRLDGDLADSGPLQLAPTSGGQATSSAFAGLGQAMSFGPANKAQVQHAELSSGKAQLTLMAWVKPSANQQALHVAVGIGDNKGSSGLSLGSIGGNWMVTNDKQTVQSNDFKPKAGTWQHLAAVFDGERIWLLVDGAVVGQKVAGLDVQVGALGIGRGADAGSPSSFDGAVDDVVVLKRALSIEEVRAYVDSKARWGSDFVPGAQADYDDVRVVQAEVAGKGAHLTHFEVIGVRPHSDSALDGVSGYWRLDGGDGAVVGANAPATTSVKWGIGRFGQPLGAAQLNGVDAWLDVPASLATQPKGDFAVEAWVKLDKLVAKTTHCAVSNQRGAGFSLCVVGTNGSVLWTVAAGDGKQGSISLGNVGLGRWHHLAGARAGNQLIVWLDGVELGRQTLTSSIAWNPLGVLRIGATPAASPGERYPFPGMIDEVLLHHQAPDGDYFAKRARGLPRVRFFAHTAAQKSGATFPVLKYTIAHGNPTAKALPVALVDLSRTQVCDALLSACSGYAAWYKGGHFITGKGVLGALKPRFLGQFAGGGNALLIDDQAGRAAFSTDGNRRVDFPAPVASSSRWRIEGRVRSSLFQSGWLWKTDGPSLRAYAHSVAVIAKDGTGADVSASAGITPGNWFSVLAQSDGATLKVSAGSNNGSKACVACEALATTGKARLCENIGGISVLSVQQLRVMARATGDDEGLFGQELRPTWSALVGP